MLFVQLANQLDLLLLHPPGSVDQPLCARCGAACGALQRDGMRCAKCRFGVGFKQPDFQILAHHEVEGEYLSGIAHKARHTLRHTHVQ